MISFLALFFIIACVSSNDASLLTTVVITEKETDFVTLDAKYAPQMDNVKSYLWREGNDPQQMKEVETLGDESMIKIKTDELLPGEYHFLLSRCDFLVVDHIVYTIRVIPVARKEQQQKMRESKLTEEDKALLRETVEQFRVFNAAFIRLISPIFKVTAQLFHYLNELHRGFMIYYQYHSDGNVSEEEFFSLTYRYGWILYGVNTSHYAAIQTPEDLKAFRAIHHSEKISWVHLFPYSPAYFAWNNQNDTVDAVLIVLSSLSLVQLVPIVLTTAITRALQP